MFFCERTLGNTFVLSYVFYALDVTSLSHVQRDHSVVHCSTFGALVQKGIMISSPGVIRAGSKHIVESELTHRVLTIFKKFFSIHFSLANICVFCFVRAFGYVKCRSAFALGWDPIRSDSIDDVCVLFHTFLFTNFLILFFLSRDRKSVV